MVVKAFYLILLVVVAGCKVVERDSLSAEEVEGIYVHTYTADVMELETGEVLGTRTVTDTIIIAKAGDRFEVSNRKWMDNDYDNEGWILPDSKADQAMPAYFVDYDSVNKKLVPDGKEKKQVPLYVAGDRLYWGEAKALEYERIDER